MRKPSNLTEFQRKYIRENYHLRKEKLAELLHVPYEYVNNYFCVCILRQKDAKDYFYSEIYKYADAGLSDVDISKKVELSPATVRNVLMKRNDKNVTLTTTEQKIYNFIKKCVKEARSAVIDLKIDNTAEMDILKGLADKKYIRLLPIEKENCKRIILEGI